MQVKTINNLFLRTKLDEKIKKKNYFHFKEEQIEKNIPLSVTLRQIGKTKMKPNI